MGDYIVSTFGILASISAPLLGLLATCDAVSDSDALVYGLGTVKLLASNRELRVQLGENNILHLLSSLLDTYCKVCTSACVSGCIRTRRVIYLIFPLYIQDSHEAAYLTSIQNVLVQVMYTHASLVTLHCLITSFDLTQPAELPG